MAKWQSLAAKREDCFKVRYVGGSYPPIFTENKIYPAAYGKKQNTKTMEIATMRFFDVADDLGERYVYDNSLFEILRDENGNLIPWTEADGDIGK